MDEQNSQELKIVSTFYFYKKRRKIHQKLYVAWVLPLKGYFSNLFTSHNVYYVTFKDIEPS